MEYPLNAETSITKETAMTEEYTRKGSIYQHESGLFRIRERKGRAFEVEYAERPALWVSTGTKDFTEADAFVRKHLHSMNRYMPDEKVTFGEFASGFFKKDGEGSYRARCRLFGKDYDDTYFKTKQGLLNNYIMPMFADWDIKRITAVIIEDWYIGLTDFRHPGKTICAEHKLSILEALSDILKEAERKGVIEANPCDRVERISIHASKEKEIFTQQEIALLFPTDYSKLEEIWGSLMWALYFSIMVDTGFRYSEVAGLSYENIDSNGGVYTKSSVKSATRMIREKIKTTGKGKGQKLGLLSYYTMELLNEYRKKVKDGYLFLADDGMFVYSYNANKVLREACARTGIDIGERTQHCFRHTFDTMMLNKLGKDLEESDVRDLMAHTGYRPEYDHRTPEQLLFRLQKIRPAIESIREAQ